jgi:hypothetical protein
MNITWLLKQFGGDYKNTKHPYPFLVGEYLYSPHPSKLLRVKNSLVSPPIAQFGDNNQNIVNRAIDCFSQTVTYSMDVDIELLINKWETQLKNADTKAFDPYITVDDRYLGAKEVNLLLDIIKKYKPTTLKAKVTTNESPGLLFDMDNGTIQFYLVSSPYLYREYCLFIQCPAL